jgi:hypothetical protein
MLHFSSRYMSIFVQKLMHHQPSTLMNSSLAYRTLFLLFGLLVLIRAKKAHKKGGEGGANICLSIYLSDGKSGVESGHGRLWQHRLLVGLVKAAAKLRQCFAVRYARRTPAMGHHFRKLIDMQTAEVVCQKKAGAAQEILFLNM